jgi:hypothetical protein
MLANRLKMTTTEAHISADMNRLRKMANLSHHLLLSQSSARDRSTATRAEQDEVAVLKTHTPGMVIDHGDTLAAL